MFIVWRGWGILAPVILIGLTMTLSFGVDSYTNIVDYADNHRWIYSIGSLLGGILCWHIGVKINRKPGRIFIDEKTGQRFELRIIHSCFFIPFEYWLVVGIIASIATLFMS